MRDDIPLDELNRAPEPGLNFGFPYCHASTISDAEFGAGSHPCRDSTGGARTLPGGNGRLFGLASGGRSRAEGEKVIRPVKRWW